MTLDRTKNKFCKVISASTIIHVKNLVSRPFKIQFDCCRHWKDSLWMVSEYRRLKYLKRALSNSGDRDSSVVTATGYGLNVPGFEPWWRQDIYSFPCPTRPTKPPVQWVVEFFPGVKPPGRVVDLSSPSNCMVKKE